MAATLRDVPGTETAPAGERWTLADPGFDDVSAGDWEAAADGALRGAPLSSLTTTLLDGVETAPLYTPHRHSTEGDPAGLPGEAPFIRGATAASGGLGWEVRQTHDIRLSGTPDAIAVDTTSGVDAVTVTRGWSADRDTEALDAAVGAAGGAGVTIHLQAGATPAHTGALLDVLDRHGVDPALARSWLGLDPIAAAACGWSPQTGAGHAAAPSDTAAGSAAAVDAAAAADLADAIEGAARYAVELADRWPHAVPLEIDGSVFADAGSTDTTELAAMLASGVGWLRALCDSPNGPSLGVPAAVRLLGFTLSAGPDPFVVTAKCRALRMCWARVLDACVTGGASSADNAGLPMRLHAVTAAAMLSALDPWVNMLRATTACFGAANGGVDAITVRPFDAVSAGQASSALGWRVAANTQLILRHESRIGAVIDPAGGSWYLEDLTRKLAHAAWGRFREIEATGGMCAAMAGGELETAIAAERALRNEQIATGEHVLVGVTDFVDSQAEQASGVGVSAGEPAGTPAVGLGVHRWAAPYEAETTGEAVTGAAGS